jgi:hypothetical protein
MTLSSWHCICTLAIIGLQCGCGCQRLTLYDNDRNGLAFGNDWHFMAVVQNGWHYFVVIDMVCITCLVDERQWLALYYDFYYTMVAL